MASAWKNGNGFVMLRTGRRNFRRRLDHHARLYHAPNRTLGTVTSALVFESNQALFDTVGTNHLIEFIQRPWLDIKKPQYVG